MTIKPVQKNEDDVEKTTSHRTSPKITGSQHDQRNQPRSNNFIEESRHRRNNQKSSCSNIVPKSQKLRYGNSSNNASSSGTTTLLDHIAEMDSLNKNEMSVTQSTSGISQLLPTTPKSNLSSGVSSNINDINTAHKSNCVANLPNSSNNNLNMANNIKAATPNADGIADDDQNTYSGYNSGDEHNGRKDDLGTEEWEERDTRFKKSMCERGFLVEEIAEDGACLFRAISLQIFGDQDMHEVIRQQTMDYIFQNREYFAQFVTEDITDYVSRKRNSHVHGNHIEIQAISEIYNRPVELYSYQTEPINIFNSDQGNNGLEPLRLSYQRGSHYNAIINQYKATVGVGLGLAGYRITEEAPNVKFMRDAVRLSEDLAIEQTMFEDKLKTTDWEATNEAIEEQIARESYIQWCRDNRNTQNIHQHPQIISPSHQQQTKQTVYNLKSNATITSSAKECNSLIAATSHKAQQRPSMVGGSSTNDLFMDTDQSELSDEAGSSKYYNYKNPLHYPQRKRRSNRRTITSTNEAVNVHHLAEETGTFALPTKKRKDDAGTSNISAQNDSSSSTSTPPNSDFYHSLLASSYSDSLNGVGEESEENILQKALEISRMEFMQSIMQRAGSMSP